MRFIVILLFLICSYNSFSVTINSLIMAELKRNNRQSPKHNSYTVYGNFKGFSFDSQNKQFYKIEKVNGVNVKIVLSPQDDSWRHMKISNAYYKGVFFNSTHTVSDNTDQLLFLDLYLDNVVFVNKTKHNKNMIVSSNTLTQAISSKYYPRKTRENIQNKSEEEEDSYSYPEPKIKNSKDLIKYLKKKRKINTQYLKSIEEDSEYYDTSEVLSIIGKKK